jgi:hypothetical protein
MENDGGILKKIILTAQNHLNRAHEGQKLLAEGKPLSEMKIEPTGLNQEEFQKMREESLANFKSMNTERLTRVYGGILFQLDRRWDDPDKGTSELEWKRLIVESIFEERGLEIPVIDLEKIKNGEIKL